MLLLPRKGCNFNLICNFIILNCLYNMIWYLTAYKVVKILHFQLFFSQGGVLLGIWGSGFLGLLRGMRKSPWKRVHVLIVICQRKKILDTYHFTQSLSTTRMWQTDLTWRVKRKVTAGLGSYDHLLQCYRDCCKSEYLDPFPLVPLQRPPWLKKCPIPKCL